MKIIWSHNISIINRTRIEFFRQNIILCRFDKSKTRLNCLFNYVIKAVRYNKFDMVNVVYDLRTRVIKLKCVDDVFLCIWCPSSSSSSSSLSSSSPLVTVLMRSAKIETDINIVTPRLPANVETTTGLVFRRCCQLLSWYFVVEELKQ